MELNYNSKTKMFSLSGYKQLPIPEGWKKGFGNYILTDNIWLVLRYRNIGSEYARKEIERYVNLIIVNMRKGFSYKDDVEIKKNREWDFYDKLNSMEQLMYRLHEIMTYKGKWKAPINKSKLLVEQEHAKGYPNSGISEVLKQEGVMLNENKPQ